MIYRESYIFRKVKNLGLAASKVLPLALVGLSSVICLSSCSAQQAGTATAAVAGSPHLEQWLKNHKAEEFKGQVWARVKLIEPQQYPYGLIVDAMLNPYSLPRHAVGTVTASGLQPKPWKDEEDVAKGLAWIAPKDDNDWLNAGQYSAWFALPMGKGVTPYAGFMVRPKAETQPKAVVLQVEFATEASENAVFHVAKEKTEEVVGARAGDGFVTSSLTVRIPGEGGLKGLQTVETFLEILWLGSSPGHQFCL